MGAFGDLEADLDVITWVLAARADAIGQLGKAGLVPFNALR